MEKEISIKKLKEWVESQKATNYILIAFGVLLILLVIRDVPMWLVITSVVAVVAIKVYLFVKSKEKEETPRESADK